MAKPIKHGLYQRRVGFSFVRDSRARDILRSLGADSRISDACSLRFAAEIGHAECVRLLIAAVGADADALAWPLVSAAGNGHPECVKLLLPGADASAKGAALRHAVGNGQAECVRLLIPATDPAADNSAALLLAAELGRDECVRLLIPASRPKSRNSQALRGAIENCHVECARLLIPVSTPLLQNKQLLTAVLKSGGASILSHMLASEPLLLAGQNLFRLKAVAAANGHFELAALLSSIFEQASIVEHMSEPKNHYSLPRRL